MRVGGHIRPDSLKDGRLLMSITYVDEVRDLVLASNGFMEYDPRMKGEGSRNEQQRYEQ